MHSAAPDVGLFDIRMPLMDGIEPPASSPARRRGPLPIVVITTFDLDEYVHGALKAGARGSTRDAGPALRPRRSRRSRGRCLIAPSVTVRLIAAFAHAQTSTAAADRSASPPARRGSLPVARPDQQRDRQRAVHHAEHRQAHVASLMTKLGARNRVEVAIWAYETGRI